MDTDCTADKNQLLTDSFQYPKSGALVSKRKNSGRRRWPVLETDSLFDNFDSDQSDLKPPSKKMTATKDNYCRILKPHRNVFQLLEDEEEQDSTYDRGKKRMFSREIRSMLYAFGDDENPLPETVSLVEDIAVRHIIEMTKKALKIGKPGKISVEDVTYLVRRDPKKFSRVKELLLLSEELRRARKAFEEDEFDVLK
ncbi:serine/threonine kinase [Schistosoma mansoni]|uniref:serine/threonine kinase n=1 Tax=Schistosoma mansoni TaxID=6183 RepID=UPI00022DCBD3|nr:serine/threonine kinase [Schistosoma mansoni]|eukprot:XP_018654697.1 serine/threonine kinase [Schistosoma mansoni]